MRGVQHRHIYHLLPLVAAALVAAVLIAIMAIAATAQEPLDSKVEAFLSLQLQGLNQLTTRAASQSSDSSETDAARRERAAALIDEAMLISNFTRQTFGSYVEDVLEDGEQYFDDARWELLLRTHREQLQNALRNRLVTDLLRFAGNLGEFELVSWQEESKKRSTAVIANGDRQFTCHLSRVDGGEWIVDDVSVDSVRLSQHYRALGRDILRKRYSPEVLEARLEETPFIRIEDFSATPAGQLPRGWGWRSKNEDHEKLYEVQRDGSSSYLAAQDSGASVILMRAAHWNPRSHPIMTWCWRADALPPGGDERYDKTNDSVAGIYVFYSQNWFRVPKHIKYVWSSTLAEGTVGRRNKIFQPFFFVAESGAASAGQWVFEVVDLEAAHKQVYGGKPKSRTVGLGILTDANSTHSFAEAFYADIRVWPRSALEQGLITDYCHCSDSSDSPVAESPIADPDCTPLPTSVKTVSARAQQ